MLVISVLVLLHACLISRCIVASISIYNTYSNIKALFNYRTSSSIVQCMFLSWFPPLSVCMLHAYGLKESRLDCLEAPFINCFLKKACISALVSTQQPSQCRKLCTTILSSQIYSCTAQVYTRLLWSLCKFRDPCKFHSFI